MLAKSPYTLGHIYRTQAGDEVRFVAVNNEGTTYETMVDESGINRYSRRDFGRVTGSPHDYSDPRNVPPPAPPWFMKEQPWYVNMTGAAVLIGLLALPSLLLR